MSLTRINKTNNRPFYDGAPIQTTEKLAVALGIQETVLLKVAKRATDLYRLVEEQKKSDGTVRQLFDARSPLKTIQHRIKERLLSKATLPDYIQGGVKGRGYVSNAARHSGSRLIISEDISNFFPSIKSELVFDLWRYFFRFSEPVAQCLTDLTTKDGAVPQGAKTSAHIANLIIWKREWKVVSELERLGFEYGRYIDDVSISTRKDVGKESMTAAISKFYGLLKSYGLKPKRSKHQIYVHGGPMYVTKLLVNKKPNLSKAKRAEIRGAVHRCELLKLHSPTEEYSKLWRRVRSQVGQLKRFEPREAEKLKMRLDRVRPSR